MVEESSLVEMVVTDSIPLEVGRPTDKIRVLSIASMLGEAIRRIHTGESVSSLFADVKTE
jgi:ribose-phosphate pyrophosphokinase